MGFRSGLSDGHAMTSTFWFTSRKYPLARALAAEHYHADVIKWKHFPRYWPFVRGIHRLPVNSPHKGQ